MSAVLLVVLGRGVSEGFFRFYFDSADPGHRTTAVRTTFWFTMATATAAIVLGLIFAEPLAEMLQLSNEPDLVRAAVLARPGVSGSPPVRNSVPAMSRSFSWAAIAARAAEPTVEPNNVGVPARTFSASHLATTSALSNGTCSGDGTGTPRADRRAARIR